MTDSAEPTAAVPWRRVAVILGVAFAVKLAVLLQLRGHPLLQPLGELDTAYYVDLGGRVARDGLLAPIGAFVSPLYVYFLAAVFAAGGSLLAAQLIQIVLGAAAVCLLFAAARHWYGGRAAVAAAGLMVLAGPFTFNEVLILQSALDPFLVACALYALTRAVAGGGTSAHLAAGVSLGLLALNRPNALAFSAAAVAAVFLGSWRRPAPVRREFVQPAVMLVSLLAVLGFNAARNHAVSGEALLVSSHGGLNLYIGNHDRADGTYTPVPGISPSIAGQARDAARLAEAALGRTVAPGEVSDYFTRLAFDWMSDHPGDALRLMLRKVGILLNHVDVPLNYSYAFYAAEPASALRLLAAGPWLLLPLGLVGLFWPSLRARRRGYWAWASFVPVYGASVVLFFVSDRYRMPLLVPLCAAAGAALVRFLDLARARRMAPLLKPVAALVVAGFLVFANLGLDDGIGGEQTRHAVWLIERGRIDEARRYVDQVALRHTHPGVLRYRVGRALLDAGRHSDAAPILGEAMAIDGPRPAIRLALGEALLGSGRPAEAAGHLAAATESGYEPDYSSPLLVRALVLAGRPDDALRRLGAMPESAAGADADGALDFGTLALEHGAPAEAARWLRLAVARAPDRSEAHEALGLAIFLQGDLQSAVPHLERACRLDPARASAHLNLAALYAELGRFTDARRSALAALRLDPDEPRAAALLKAIPR